MDGADTNHAATRLTATTTTAPVCQFPMASFPTTLQHIYRDLASEYAVAPETVGVVCLWSLMRAAAPGSRLRGHAEEIPINLDFDSLFFVEHGNTPLAPLLDRILEPVMQTQAGLVEAFKRFDPNKLALREAQLKRECDLTVRRNQFPDPAHLGFLRVQLDLIQAQRRPILMIRDRSADQLEDCLPHCLDKAPGVVFTDARLATENLERRAKAISDGTEEANEWDPITGSGDEALSASKISASLLSQLAWLCCCDSAFLDEHIDDWSQTFRNSFFLNVHDVQTIDRKAITRELGPWDSMVRHALAPRLTRSHPVWTMTPKAASELASGAMALSAAQPATPFSLSPTAITGMCGRLALALQAGLQPPRTELPSETVECALATLQWLIAERESVLQGCVARTQAIRDAAAEVAMLNRIRSRGGRMRRRSLVRMYYQQRQEIHAPVLRRLIAKGEAFIDEEGFVCLTEPFDHALIEQSIDLRTY